MPCAFHIDDVRTLHRRTLVSLGRYRRLSDFVSASLAFLRDDVLLRSVLAPEALRERAAGTWLGTPVLSALHAHLGRLHRDHLDCGLRLVTSAPSATLVHLANLWIRGGTALAFGAGGGGLAAMSARLDDARVLFAEAVRDVPTASAAIAEAVRALDEAAGASALVVCAIDVERGDTLFLDGAARLMRSSSGMVLPIVLRQGRCGAVSGYASMDDGELAASLGAAGFAVRTVNLGLQFEARLYTALEWALHTGRGEGLAQARQTAPESAPHSGEGGSRAGDVIPREAVGADGQGAGAEGHPLIVLTVPRSLAMPPAVADATHREGVLLPSALRSDTALFEVFRGWLDGYAPFDLVEMDGRPDRDLLDLLPPPPTSPLSTSEPSTSEPPASAP